MPRLQELVRACLLSVRRPPRGAGEELRRRLAELPPLNAAMTILRILKRLTQDELGMLEAPPLPEVRILP